MEIYGEISKVRAAVKAWKKEGLTVGFVPTMGYLHEGHKSLIDAARKENDRVVVSIFVNPMQFGPTEDLESYPRDLKKDAALCEAAGVDIIFHPEPEDMYHDPHAFGNVCRWLLFLCGYEWSYHRTLWKKPSDSLPWCADGCIETLPHCNSGPRILWPERCPAACRHPSHGQRLKCGYPDHRLPDHP